MEEKRNSQPERKSAPAAGIAAKAGNNPERRFRFRMRGFALTLLLAAAAGLSGCKKEIVSAPPPPRPEVAVMTVTTQTVPDEPEFMGQAESSRPVEIRSQVTGIIKERFFQEGREVKVGDRLYQIDPVPFRAAFSSAKAKVAFAEARLAQARQNVGRVKPLLEEQAVSQKDVDDAATEELAAAATLEGAKGELMRAQFDLDNTLIAAPIAGLIERTRVYEGRLVSAQSDLLTVVHQVNPIHVTVSAPESYFLQRRKELAEKKNRQPSIYALRGVITFLDGTTYSHEGLFDFADVVYHAETGSRQGRFVFPNPERILLPGQSVKVRVKGYTKSGAVLIPQRAVQQGAKGPIVYVVGPDDKVEVRDVQAAAWRGDQWLLEKGLQAGERVVVDGIQRIVPGAQVKPIPAADAGSPPPGPKPDPKKEPEIASQKEGSR